MSDHDRPALHDPRSYWLDEPKNVKLIIRALIGLCVLLFVADAVYHKHSHFSPEDWFGFYALFAFVMGGVLILVVRVIRVFLIRDEEYYEKNE